MILHSSLLFFSENIYTGFYVNWLGSINFAYQFLVYISFLDILETKFSTYSANLAGRPGSALLKNKMQYLLFVHEAMQISVLWSIFLQILLGKKKHNCLPSTREHRLDWYVKIEDLHYILYGLKSTLNCAKILRFFFISEEQLYLLK
jgi:hypothetical protein